MLPEDAVSSLLVTAGIGVFGATSGWSIQIGRMVDSPNTQICIYTTGGKPPNPKWAIDYPSFQVKVRGVDTGYTAARQKMLDIKNALLGVPAQNIGSDNDRIDGIIAIGDVISIGRDDAQRPMLAMNFQMFWEPALVNAGYRR